MKKLLILLLACSLFAACNNNKAARERDRSSNSRDRDDYRDNRDNNSRNDEDRDRDRDRNTDYTNDNDDRNNSSSSSSSSWTSRQRDEFTTSCVNTAVEGGMDRSMAQSYCSCMQGKLERLYPNPNDANNLDVNSTEMQNMMRDCLR
jgi:hypothetical protein